MTRRLDHAVNRIGATLPDGSEGGEQSELGGQPARREIFARCFVAAGGPITELHSAVENTFSSPESSPIAIHNSEAHQHQTKELAWGSLGTKGRMAQSSRPMAQTRIAARTPEERQRDALLGKGQCECMLKGKP